MKSTLSSSENLKPVKRLATPYQFCGKYYDTPQSLARGLVLHWEEGNARMRRGDIAIWVRTNFPENNDLYNKASWPCGIVFFLLAILIAGGLSESMTR